MALHGFLEILFTLLFINKHLYLNFESYFQIGSWLLGTIVYILISCVCNKTTFNSIFIPYCQRLQLDLLEMSPNEHLSYQVKWRTCACVAVARGIRAPCAACFWVSDRSPRVEILQTLTQEILCF